MRIAMLLPLLLAGCSEPLQESSAAPATTMPSIIGLYERAGVPDRPSRICIAGQAEDRRFGLNSSYEGPQSCTAKGSVRQTGAALTLVIDGDPACRLSAVATATGLTLNAPEGDECGYYCGAHTDLDAGKFGKVGETEADARKAVDIVGESLC